MIPAGFEEREAQLRRILTLPKGYEDWLARGCKPAGPEPRIYETYRRDWGLYDRNTAFDYLVAHVLQMEIIDQALQIFLDRLHEMGLYDNSVVALMADHGEMNLEQGLIDKGVYGHPKVARVPMIMKLPGARYAGHEVNTPVSLLDVAPTMLEFAGVKPSAHLDGESLLKRLAEPDAVRHQAFVFEAGWHIAPNPAVAIQRYEGPKRHFRYVYNACSDIDELYDMNDPEARNLIEDEDHDELRRRMVFDLWNILASDDRWRCYRQAFELDNAEELPSQGGDGQMFIPV
jgi:choline-sulfatase